MTCACLLALSGCANARDGDVEQVATHFYDALAAQDGAAACAVLAPPSRDELEESAGKPCAQAVLEEDIAAGQGRADVKVFGTMSQVRWQTETTFLTRYPDGWRVLAAGCALPEASTLADTNDTGDPETYECSVQN